MTTKWKLRSGRSAVPLCMLGAAILLATGCMMSPHHLESIGSTTSEFVANGCVLESGATVQIQYFNNNTDAWHTIATTTATDDSYVLNWSDQEWHTWNVGHLVVPANGWVNEGRVGFSARVRARSGSSTLFTFDEEFAYCFDEDHTMISLWQECGHGNEVTIRATN